MCRWHKLRRLSWSECWLLLQALGLLPLTALAVRFLGFRRCHLALASLLPAGERQPNHGADATLLPQAQATARMVRAAARHGFYRAHCLPQSLSLWLLLRRQGVASELRIGVRKNAGRLEAHAWVELCGVALDDPMNSRLPYAPFARSILPAAVTS